MSLFSSIFIQLVAYHTHSSGLWLFSLNIRMKIFSASFLSQPEGEEVFLVYRKHLSGLVNGYQASLSEQSCAPGQDRELMYGGK